MDTGMKAVVGFCLAVFAGTVLGACTAALVASSGGSGTAQLFSASIVGCCALFIVFAMWMK